MWIYDRLNGGNLCRLSHAGQAGLRSSRYRPIQKSPLVPNKAVVVRGIAVWLVMR